MSRPQTLAILELSFHFLAAVLLINAEGRTLQNIALGKAATQDEQDTSTGSWPASNAVDGKTDCGTVDSTTVTLSGYSNRPWWQVDLGAVYNIERIEVYGRADGTSSVQLRGFRLILSNFPLNNSATVEPVYIGNTSRNIYNITGIQTAARFCRLEVPPGFRESGKTGPIVLCEVKVFGRAVESLLPNIGQSVTATMSPVFSNWTAARAIDNNPSHEADLCHCCSATNGASRAWWQVDLGRKYRISGINVYGRTDKEPAQSRGLSLIISNSSMTPITDGTTIQNGTTLQNDYSEQLHMYSIRIKEPVVFQYFLVERSTSAVMTICEVEMFKAACTDRQYGPECHECGHCHNTDRCNQQTGVCPHGCADGYIPSDKLCTTPCTDRQYGPECHECGHCHNADRCNQQTGVCPHGCADGYILSDKLCTTPCTERQYGPECHDCGHCRNADPCHQQTGFCPHGCADGYLPTDRLCNTSCTQNKYGPNCALHCGHCSKSYQCNNVNGLSGCVPGYMGVTCTNACSNGTFGKDCGRNCHCFNAAGCNNVNGTCPNHRCASGWQGLSCSSACNYRTFGQDCNTTCHCFNNNTCTATTGICPNRRCDPGWQGDTCSQVCPHGKFGDKCGGLCHCYNNTECNNVNGICLGLNWSIGCGHSTFGQYCNRTCHCYDDADCNNVNGSCPNNRCAPGWQGDTCSEECSHGKFGDNCSSSCHCYNNTECKNDIGMCLNHLCAPGWQGSCCSDECEHSKFSQDCNETCHCGGKVDCNPVNGSCPNNRCAPGWLGDTCSQVCPHGKFGGNCSRSCHCYNNTECNTVDGVCFNRRCAPGWQGSACSSVCEHRTFGQECKNVCHCLNNTQCDLVSGHCPNNRCEPWWQGETCSQVNVNLLMRPNVTIRTSMSSVTPGYTSDKAVDGDIGPDLENCNCCSETLNAPVSWWTVDMHKMYPVNEIRIFGRSKEGLIHQLGGFEVMFSNSSTEDGVPVYSSSSSNINIRYTIHLPTTLTRFITIRRVGVLAVCEVEVIEGECSLGWFGDQCSKRCHCADNLPCNKLDGTCQTPVCDIGWLGPSCEQYCPSGFFGQRCREICQCEGGHTCTHDYGICPGPCLSGFAGPHCNQMSVTENMTSRNNNVTTIAIACSCSFLLVVGIVIAVIVYRKRRSRMPAASPTISNGDMYEKPSVYVNSTAENPYDTITQIPLAEMTN